MSADAPTTRTGCGGQLSRRSLLSAAGLATVVSVGSSVFPIRAALATGPVPTDTLVVLFLRGGADWLSLVSPQGDPHYAAARPTIAVPAKNAIALDGFFGLHPNMDALKPFWDSGQLAFVHAAGSPDPSRSHFDAEYAIETGAYDKGRTYTGWLDRYLSALPGSGSFDAVAHSNALPQSLSGPAGALAIGGIGDFDLPDWLGKDYPVALHGLYAGISHPLARQANETLSAIATVRAVLSGNDSDSKSSAYPGTDLGRAFADVGQLIKANVGARVITLDYGGWDMHQDLGYGGGGQMGNSAGELGDAIGAFAKDMGSLLGNVTLVTITEFGRRVEENGSHGLDHGHGQAMLLLGGGTRGQKVYGRWPSLAPGALDQGDLAATTDIRSVFAEVLHDRMGASDAAVRQVFPHWNPVYTDAIAPR
ncbi:MAG TPA: DUF1501 domain-containing protein [Mycobacteriales bacterium]|nr:DUF1501 domain-containing protein [Mycobacteriales bacterium]